MIESSLDDSTGSRGRGWYNAFKYSFCNITHNPLLIETWGIKYLFGLTDIRYIQSMILYEQICDESGYFSEVKSMMELNYPIRKLYQVGLRWRLGSRGQICRK